MVAVNLKSANVVRALDSNGAAVSGAKLYVYERGTTTEVTTYLDLALGSPNAHPVVADSSGSWGDIYLTGGVYKINVTTPGGTSLPGYPVDDISAVSQSGLPEGTIRPSQVKAGERWLDVTVAAVPIVKWYDGTDDITVYTLNYSANTVAWPATSVSVADSGGYFVGSNVEVVLAEAAVLIQEAEVVTQGQHTIWIPAVAMTARTTTGASTGTAETATNKIMIETLDFDTDSDDHVQFSILMPRSWNRGPLVFQAVWSHPSTTTNFGVVFFMQAVALANDDALDTAFGTAISVTDTGGTTDDVYISPESAAVTVAGTPGEEELVIFQVYRDVSDGSDTMAVDARLHGVKVHYTTDANTDD